ncbi:Transposon Ty3-G Gag-Pol polyprotein [Araneus ventricosus]|uniref:Transposon Ty3-G Gag-Pol polyprotein n=1 Tax=Araneus ventricosus TaxID=182803 RepID=A0A4Y2R5K8_ARAVE|nr:Transposon Ty3-G Gag-Pol polyprotein [Araneus ventricosus]GBN71007.1 Transposon Ty3-G Gag-Pol polyprotein [Araneus ventricosus]
MTKFNYVVSHLPPEVASLVRDILMNPDARDPYTHLRTELINRSGESSQQEIRQLLSGKKLDEATRGLPGVYAFVEDILIASKNPEQHYQHLKTLFSRLDEYGLCINVSKCIFGAWTIDFLGFNLSENGIRPLPDKVKRVLDFPKPDTLTQLRRFLGMFNFYRCFIPKAAHILAPIVQFLEGHTNKKTFRSSVRKSSEQLKWNENGEQAFISAENAIAEAALLRHPIPGAQLSLWVNASDVTIEGTFGSILVPRLGWERFAFRPRDVNGFFSTERRGLILVPRSFRTSRFTLGSDIFLLRAQQIKRSACDIFVYGFRFSSSFESPKELWRSVHLLPNSKLCWIILKNIHKF